MHVMHGLFNILSERPTVPRNDQTAQFQLIIKRLKALNRAASAEVREA